MLRIDAMSLPMHKRVSKAPVEEYNKHAKVGPKQWNLWKGMLCSSVLDT